MTDAPAEAPIHPQATEPIDGGTPPTGGGGTTGGTDGGGAAKGRAAKSSSRNIIEWGIVLGGALVIAALIRAFLFQAFYIPSPSMNPTLVQNDRVVVNKLAYDFHDVRHGDIVVFSRPPGVPPNDKELIKRVIGLPGDTVSLQGGKVYLNGKAIKEPYIAKGSTSEPLLFSTCVVNLTNPLTIPKGKVFVMGDNRNQSLDGRCFGPIPESTIVGRAFVLVWPVSHIDWL